MYHHFFMSNIVKDCLPFPTRSCSSVLATHVPVQYELLVTLCEYMCRWEIFTKLVTMFSNNGIYRDVTLLVGGWCAMACQHVHNLGEHAFIAWSHCCLKWWYWCFGAYHTTAVRTCWQAITHQRSTGNGTFLHPLLQNMVSSFAENLPAAHVLTGCHSTTSLNQIGKCVANPKL
jgi:hypothetical protein